MNTSTIEARGGATKRFGVLLLGLAVALAGTLALSGSRAEAVEKTITFDKGQVNLGFAFQGAELLPAQSALPGSVSNPDFNPALPVSAENPTTVPSATATPLFDINALDPDTFTTPDQEGVLPNSFTPLGCGTPVTFGLYFATPAGGTPDPTDPDTIIWNPADEADNPFTPFLVQPLANAGAPGAAEYYRVLPAGAILAEGDDPVTFENPFNPALPDVELTAPYPAADTLWQPYAMGVTNALDPTEPPVPAPLGKNPTGSFPSQVPFTGTAGLNFQQNTVEGGFCANPTDGTATVDLNEADGTFTGTPANFKMPIMIVPNPLDASPVPITLDAPEGITGTFDAATGATRIDGKMEVRVLVGLADNPLGEYCALELPGREPGGFGSSTPIPNNGFALTTDYALPVAQGFAGTPYSGAAGLEGDGALVGTWNQVADSTSFGGADCDTVNSVSKGFGGIWLSSNVATPGAISGNCSEFNRVGTFPECLTRARFGKVTVKGPAKAKRNKVATYRVRVPNAGEANATNVRVAVKGKGVKARAKGGVIQGKKAKTIRVKVRAKRAGKVRMTFTVTGKGITKKVVRKTVRVR